MYLTTLDRAGRQDAGLQARTRYAARVGQLAAAQPDRYTGHYVISMLDATVRYAAAGRNHDARTSAAATLHIIGTLDASHLAANREAVEMARRICVQVMEQFGGQPPG
jgi:hypothetical protein